MLSSVVSSLAGPSLAAIQPVSRTTLQLLPSGFQLPPLPYLLAFVAVGGAVGYGLLTRDPAFDQRHVLALVPWMVTGAAAHVLYVLGVVPSSVRPLFGTPSVYVSVALLAGAVWLATLGLQRPVPRELAGVGSLLALATVGSVLAEGVAVGRLSPLLPTVGIVVGTGLGVATVTLLGRVADDVSVAGKAAVVAVVAHGIDGVTTAVGFDLIGFEERTPLSALILHFGAGLPTADLLGAGWLFVLVKLTIASVAVAAIAPTVREAKREGFLLLTLVTAVGLGPGVHNALLFAVSV
jgi:uncharacterized membrane protein